MLPRGWIRIFWTVDPGGGIPSKSQFRLLETHVYTSEFSARKLLLCNNHMEHFHASGLLNLIFGCPGGAAGDFSTHLNHPLRHDYDV